MLIDDVAEHNSFCHDAIYNQSTKSVFISFAAKQMFTKGIFLYEFPDEVLKEIAKVYAEYESDNINSFYDDKIKEFWDYVNNQKVTANNM